MAFIDRLEMARQRKKMSQKELTEKAGIRQPSIPEWKKNGSVPHGDICAKLAAVLEVDLQWLITGENSSAIPVEDYQFFKAYQALKPIQKETVQMMVRGFTRNNDEDFLKTNSKSSS